MTERPCRYCVAAWSHTGQDGEPVPPPAIDCEWSHRDDPRVYALATAMAKVFQNRKPTDEQIGWFLEDANDVVDDFGPAPEQWTVRLLRDQKRDESEGIDRRVRINGVTYVCQAGGKGARGQLVRLSTWRQWQREADQTAITATREEFHRDA